MPGNIRRSARFPSQARNAVRQAWVRGEAGTMVDWLYEVDFLVLYPLTVVLIAGAAESAPGLADDRAALLMMHPTLAR